MELDADAGKQQWKARLFRADGAHQGPAGRHAAATVLCGSERRQSQGGSASLSVLAPISSQQASTTATGHGPLSAGTTTATAQFLEQFRDNLSSLASLVREPLVWNDADGSTLAAVREALSLTEAVLVQVELTGTGQLGGERAAVRIGLLAQAVQRRIDELLGRVQRLSGLRQRLFRTSALFEAAAQGRMPTMEQIVEISAGIIEQAAGDQRLMFVYPQPAEASVSIAAHGLNVALVAARLTAQEPAWKQEQQLAVTAALLQDLGMIYMPPEILGSAEPLNATELVLVRKHPGYSASMVEQMRGRDERLVAAVYQHHERLDGSGYPDAVRADRISSVARLLSVADSYVGMQSPRAYRPAMTAEQALSEVGRSARQGRLDLAWVRRLPEQPPQWVSIPTGPEPTSGASALAVSAA